MCRSQKNKINLLTEVGDLSEDYSSDEEGGNTNEHLLHVLSLEMNGVSSEQNTSGIDEWRETLQVGNSTLQ